MTRWTGVVPVVKAYPFLACIRKFTTHTHEAVQVRCGSAGHVTIDLYNLAHFPSRSPIIIYLPPSPAHNAPPPEWLQSFPVASINYRWNCSLGAAERYDAKKPLRWPIPVHDTAFAHAWITKTFAPEDNGRRDMYVFGSHLGASLAMSLGLTESHPHNPLGIRGIVAHNGVYNWTMFLPDHRVNQAEKRPTLPSEGFARGIHLSRLQQEVPALFDRPTNMFDSFASPSLFFHNPGLLVPKSFSTTLEDSYMVDALAGSALAPSEHNVTVLPPKAPRKSHMVFPPRKSTLKIPETLLLYSSSAPAFTNGRKRRSKKSRGHTFATQAEEMADLLRRAIVKGEYKERANWDGEANQAAADKEAVRRIQVEETGPEMAELEVNEPGKDKILQWLQNKV